MVSEGMDLKPEVGTTEVLNDGRIFVYDADGTWHVCIPRIWISCKEN